MKIFIIIEFTLKIIHSINNLESIINKFNLKIIIPKNTTIIK